MILNNNEIIIKLLKETKEYWKIDNNLAPLQYIREIFLRLSEPKNNLTKFIQLYIYEFFTHESIRDRKVTSREFEDFLSFLLEAKITDEIKRKNEKNIDVNFKHKISNLYPNLNDVELNEILFDLSTNKREKADLVLKDGTNISIKTLKGFSLCDKYIKDLVNKSQIEKYCNNFPGLTIDKLKLIMDYKNKNINNSHCKELEELILAYKEIKDKLKPNTELNIGALSHRGLFKNIIDEKLNDRKNGLGSRQQMITLLNKLKTNNKLNKFKERLKIFLEYLYEDEIYFIAYKSGIKMQIFSFPGKELNNLLLNLLDQCIPCFAAVFHRWENNNLRLNIAHLINENLWVSDTPQDYQDKKYFHIKIKKEKIQCKIDNNPFKKDNLIILDFRKSLDDQEFISKIENYQKEYINNLVKKIKD